MVKELKMQGKKIGSNHPPYLIAEMSANHNGSLKKALETMRLASECGADAIKIQTYTADTMTIDSDNEDVKESEEKSLHNVVNSLENSRYGINLTDDDKVNIDTVRQKIFEDEEIEKYMNGANSEQNKQDYFKKQFDNVILSLLKDRFDFYKKLDENSGLKNLIFGKIYKDYRESKNK